MAAHPPPASQLPAATLTVAAVARRLGVAPATLRTWARRYGLGPTQHTAGSHRRYDAHDLARLLIMRRLTHEGIAPAQAAALALADDLSAVAEAGADFFAAGAEALGRSSTAGLDLQHRNRPPGGGRVVPLPQASAQVRGLARAAMALDAHGVSEMLRRSVRTEGVVVTWETLAVPVLVGLGERFAAHHEGIEVEHMFSECILGVFRSTVDRLMLPRNRVGVLLACPGDEQHSLPLYAIAAALAERGVGTRQLGMRVPPEALLAAVRRAGPGIVLLYASLPVASTESLEHLGRVRPAPRVLVGGPGWPAQLPATVTRTWTLSETVEDVIASVL